MKLKESDLYQAILRKGEAREARKILLLQGRFLVPNQRPVLVC
jgi:hypothetical protein